jgi:hypothetical protein
MHRRVQNAKLRRDVVKNPLVLAPMIPTHSAGVMRIRWQTFDEYPELAESYLEPPKLLNRVTRRIRRAQ